MRQFAKCTSRTSPAQHENLLLLEQLSRPMACPGQKGLQILMSPEQGLSAKHTLIISAPSSPLGTDFTISAFNALARRTASTPFGLRCATWFIHRTKLWPFKQTKVVLADQGHRYTVYLKGTAALIQYLPPAIQAQSLLFPEALKSMAEPISLLRLRSPLKQEAQKVLYSTGSNDLATYLKVSHFFQEPIWLVCPCTDLQPGVHPLSSSQLDANTESVMQVLAQYAPRSWRRFWVWFAPEALPVLVQNGKEAGVWGDVTIQAVGQLNFEDEKSTSTRVKK